MTNRLRHMKLTLLLYLPFFLANLWVTVYVCWSDGQRRLIPNQISKWVLLINTIAAIAYGFIWSSLPIALLCFAVLLLLWFANVFGAGDVKLLSAFTVGIQPDLLIPALVTIGIFGGIQLATMYLWAKVNQFKAFKKGIPYGIPISLSCLIFTALSALSH